jgi:hypothetical protein
MTTSEKRSLFIARKVDGAAEFIEAHGAVTISELAKYLAGTGVDVRGDDGLTGRDLALYRGDKRFAARRVIATGSTEFVLIMLALLVNRNVELDLSDPALIKLIWGGRWDEPAERKPREIKTPTGSHYHLLFVRDPGGPEQVAECCEGQSDRSLACHYLDEIYFPEFIDEGWEAIWIIACGPDRCRRDEIPNLPVEEWGSPYWGGGDAVYAAADDGENPYLVPDVDAEEPPF